MIYAVFVPPVKRISHWKCFHNCDRLEASSLTYRGIAIFAPVGPLNNWEHKVCVESNRLSTCIKSTLMMSRNHFNLYWVDLFRNDFVWMWPNFPSVQCNDIVMRPNLAFGSGVSWTVKLFIGRLCPSNLRKEVWYLYITRNKQQFKRTLIHHVQQAFQHWSDSSDRAVIKREWFN